MPTSRRCCTTRSRGTARASSGRARARRAPAIRRHCPPGRARPPRRSRAPDGLLVLLARPGVQAPRRRLAPDSTASAPPPPSGGPPRMAAVVGLGAPLQANLATTRREVDLDRELARVARAGVVLLTWDDPRYPARLRQIAGAPPVLYVKGALLPEDDLALAVVGTRRMTSYGRDVTARLAGELTAAGLTIVSGLARGVDACAHEAALRAGGRTLAILGCGVDVVYPADHRALAARIAERGQGALVSEFHLGTPPDAPNFPARNRLISGLALGVLVTEAPAKSGALITTDFAAEQGRDIFAVPGSILGQSSAG